MSVTSSGNLNTDLTGIGATETTLLITGTTSFTGPSLPVPSNVHLQILDAGRLSIGSGQVLTIEGTFECGRRQAFVYADSTSNVDIAEGTTLFPEWWGVIQGFFLTANAQLALNGDALRHMLRMPATHSRKARAISFEPGLYCYSGRLDFWSKDPHSIYWLQGDDTTLCWEGEPGDCAMQLGSAAHNCSSIYFKMDGINLSRLSGATKYPEASMLRVEQANDIAITPTNGKLARSRADALAGIPIGLVDDGSGTLRIASLAGLSAPQRFTADASTDLLTFGSSHGFADNDPVRVNVGPNNSLAVLPTAAGGDLDANDLYYAETSGLASNTMGLRRTSGGARVNLTSAGVGELLLGSAAEIANQQFNGWSWKGGKVDGTGTVSEGPQIDVFSIAAASITDHNCSNGLAGALLVEDCSEVTIDNFYTEGISDGTVGNDHDVVHFRNSSHVAVRASRINGGQNSYDNNCDVGIRLTSVRGARIETCVFTRHQRADIYVDGGDATSISIDATCRTDGVQTGRVRIGNASGQRLTRDYASLGPMPPFNIGEPKDNLIPSQDFAHWTWEFDPTAGFTIPPMEVLAPDGRSLVRTIDLPVSGASPSELRQAVGSGGLAAYAGLSCDEDLEDKHVLLRFWWRPISIISGSVGTGRLISRVWRQALAGIEPATNIRHEYEGVWDGSGDWMFAEHRYPASPHQSSYPTSILYGVAFQASNIGDGVRVAIYGVEVVVVGANDPAPPYDPFGELGRRASGAVPPADVVNATFAGRTRRRARAIEYTELAGSTASASFDLGVVPAGSRVLAASVPVDVPVTGGALASVTCDIGSAGDPDAIIDGADVRSAAVDGMAASSPAGIAPNKVFRAGAALQATLTSTGANLSAATAGNIKPEVLIWVPSGTIEPPEVPSCKLWLMADESTKSLSGYDVATWKDQSGNGNDFAQATSSARPRSARRHKGRPTVLFDGHDDLLISAAAASAIYDVDPDTGGTSLYMLLSIEMSQGLTLSTATGNWNTCGGIFCDATFWFQLVANEMDIGLSVTAGSATRAVISYPKGMFLFSMRYAHSPGPVSDEVNVRINGGTEVPFSGAGLANAAGLLRLGTSYGNPSGLFSRFRMLEMCAFDRPLTTQEDGAIREYMMTIAGI